MGRKQLGFPGFEKPRQPRVKRMRVADAGNFPDGSKGIRFECLHCGHDTGWIPDECTISENKLGLPCPKCNSDNRLPACGKPSPLKHLSNPMET